VAPGGAGLPDRPGGVCRADELGDGDGVAGGVDDAGLGVGVAGGCVGVESGAGFATGGMVLAGVVAPPAALPVDRAADAGEPSAAVALGLGVEPLGDDVAVVAAAVGGASMAGFRSAITAWMGRTTTEPLSGPSPLRPSPTRPRNAPSTAIAATMTRRVRRARRLVTSTKTTAGLRPSGPSMSGTAALVVSASTGVDVCCIWFTNREGLCRDGSARTRRSVTVENAAGDPGVTWRRCGSGRGRRTTHWRPQTARRRQAARRTQAGRRGGDRRAAPTGGPAGPHEHPAWRSWSDHAPQPDRASTDSAPVATPSLGRAGMPNPKVRPCLIPRVHSWAHRVTLR
jgi:hypothetical protein